MKKFHEVESIEFHGEIMTLRTDGKVYQLNITGISPRLAKASSSARNHYQVSPSGFGIHWPQADEDLTVDGLIRASQGSYERQTEPRIGALREGEGLS